MTAGGFVVPEDYLKIAHGYATTSHSSQGLTANFAVVFGASFDQNYLERAKIDAIASAGKLAEAVITAEGLSISPMVAGNKGDSGSFFKPVALRYWSRSSSSLW